MARPIQLDIPTRHPAAENRQRLAELTEENAAALADVLELARVLHEHKVLDTLRGAVGAGGSLVSYLAEAVAQPESVRALRNFLALSKLFAQLDPELIDAVRRSIPESWQDKNARGDARAPSLWKVAKVLGSAPARRALLGVGLVLAGVGMYMSRDKASRNG